MVVTDLRQALIAYLRLRLTKDGSLKPFSPLFATPKGGPYSPNTMQENIALMLRVWAGTKKTQLTQCADARSLPM